MALIWCDKNGELLKHGDRIVHDDGDVETIYVNVDGDAFIDGIKSLFPLYAFANRYDDGKHYLTEFRKGFVND